jgi:hypothetical protein
MSNCGSHRLQLCRNNVTYENVLNRRARWSDEPGVRVQTMLPCPEKIKSAMTASDANRAEWFDENSDALPSSLPNRLEAVTATEYERRGNPIRAQALPLPRARIPGTVDRLKPESFLPTSYAALANVEEACRLLLNQQSTASHAITTLEAVVKNINDHARQHKGTGFTPEQQKKLAELFDAISDTRHAIEDASTTTAELTQMATYHRRWSLVQGAPETLQREALAAPLVGATNALGLSQQALSKIKSEVKSEQEPTEGNIVMSK